MVSPQGKEAVVAVLKTGHFFGEQCLSGHTVRSMSATALEDAVVLRIEQARMIQVLQKEPRFSELFLKYVLSYSMRVEEDLVGSIV